MKIDEKYIEQFSEIQKLIHSAKKKIDLSINCALIDLYWQIEEREFYLRVAKQEGYSTRELERQINSNLFERTIAGDKKLSAVLREIHPKAESGFKDKYVLDFLSLPKHHNERDFRKAIILNLKAD